jgi:anti-sigma factor RsiW
MSCSPFDLRDYALGELADSERRQVEQHARTCRACREELDRIGAVWKALRSIPDEEIPQRIGFVSDPVFKPSRLRGWWLGFASAAMLSGAMVFSALVRPAPATPAPAKVDTAALERQFDARTREAVRTAVADVEKRQEARTVQLLAEADRRHELELQSIRLAVEENLSRMQKRVAGLKVALASADFGEAR